MIYLRVWVIVIEFRDNQFARRTALFYAIRRQVFCGHMCEATLEFGALKTTSGTAIFQISPGAGSLARI